MDYLHFSCHFFSDALAPMQSYLALSPGTAPASDGRLTAQELARLPLKAQLVALPCCASAGSLREGEGRMGATWALLAAGARSALVTYWNVDDASAPLAMEALYEHVRRGWPLGESVRQAQLRLIHDERYAHPYYWAPYVLVQRGRPGDEVKEQEGGAPLWAVVGAALLLSVGLGLGIVMRRPRGVCRAV
jgi:CHAT domain-containing protein